MASEVDICNLALAHLSDEAAVSSISPPDGSAQADHCKRFYPIARDALLEMHPWTFAKGRAADLGELTSTLTAWEYAYGMPAGIIKPLTALRVDEIDEDNALDMMVEGDTIYSHEPIGSLIVTRRITDTTKFSPLFVTSLAWLLASYLAGPVTRDANGSIKKSCLQMFNAEMGLARPSNAGIDKHEPTHVPAHIKAR